MEGSRTVSLVCGRGRYRFLMRGAPSIWMRSNSHPHGWWRVLRIAGSRSDLVRGLKVLYVSLQPACSRSRCVWARLQSCQLRDCTGANGNRPRASSSSRGAEDDVANRHVSLDRNGVAWRREETAKRTFATIVVQQLVALPDLPGFLLVRPWPLAESQRNRRYTNRRPAL